MTSLLNQYLVQYRYRVNTSCIILLKPFVEPVRELSRRGEGGDRMPRAEKTGT
ncbi:hypothetical protein [Priestia megaterium]|uniref:hypothetical protein n=1 Tax=Priestia megaterium TaxID=1404 RepID=UPI001B3A4D8B|nr:hypothetical protein [Priestia megaterium]